MSHPADLGQAEWAAGGPSAATNGYGSCEDPTKAPSRTRAFVVAGVVYCCAIGEGYDFGVFPPVLARLQEVFALKPQTVGLIAALVYAGMMVGALAAGSVADCVGRKLATCVASLLMIAGVLAMGLASAVSEIIVGRVVLGLGLGMAIPLGGLYVVETAPPDVRGMLGATFGGCMSVGVALGGVVGAVLQDTWQDWRVMLLIGTAIPLVIIFALLLPYLPESPHWLVAVGQRQAALRALCDLGRSEHEAERTVKEIERELAEKHHSDSEAWRAILLPGEAKKRQLRTSIGVLISMFLCGGASLLIFAPLVLKPELGRRDAITAAAVINACGSLAGISGVRLSDVVGRRALLLGGYVVIAVSEVALSLLLSPLGLEAGRTRGLWMSLWLLFGLSAWYTAVAPVTLFYSGEILPADMRAKAMGLGNSAARAAALIVTATLPVVLQASAGAAFAGLAAVTICIVTFVYLSVRETKGMDLEAISQSFQS